MTVSVLPHTDQQTCACLGKDYSKKAPRSTKAVTLLENLKVKEALVEAQFQLILLAEADVRQIAALMRDGNPNPSDRLFAEQVNCRFFKTGLVSMKSMNDFLIIFQKQEDNSEIH